MRAVLRDLVLAVAGLGDGEVGGLFDCQRSFADLWGLEVEIDELRLVVDELVESKLATRSGKSIRLASHALTELEAKAHESQETEVRAFREWELDVRRKRPGLSTGELELLRADLQRWLHMIILRHGAEAAMMLYPEEERARRFFETVDAEDFDLPDHDQSLNEVRTEVLPLFIRCPTPDQRRYLGGLLNTSFYMTVLTIDPDAEHLVRAQMQGHRIYLDTNFLYAVVGAAPPDEVYSSRRLIKLSRELGFEFAVTPWTIAELRTSIAHSRREIEEQSAFIRPDLADAMLRAAGDKGFNRLFWQTYRDKRTQPKDVFARLEHFDQELADYGILERTEGCEAIDQQEEKVLLYASLLNAERWPYQREPVVLEHDAKCRLLIEKLRGSGRITLSNTRFWFLTYDTKLPRFAEKVPDNGDAAPELPFCVSPSIWVQIIRALAPRTEDFDRTAVDLLTSPYLGYRPAVNSAIVQEVVGRMDHFEDASPEMAIAVITDSAKVSQINAAVSTEDEGTVEEAVRVAYSAKAREMEAGVATSQKRVTEIQELLREAEARADDAEGRDAQESAKTRRLHETQREEWSAEKARLERLLADVQDDRDRATSRAAEADHKVKSVEEARQGQEIAQAARASRRRRIGAGLLLSGIGAALGLVLSLVVFSNAWAVGGAVVAGAALVLLGIRVVVGRDWGGEIVTWGGLLAAIAAIVVAIIATVSRHGERRGPTPRGWYGVDSGILRVRRDMVRPRHRPEHLGLSRACLVPMTEPSEEPAGRLGLKAACRWRSAGPVDRTSLAGRDAVGGVRLTALCGQQSRAKSGASLVSSASRPSRAVSSVSMTEQQSSEVEKVLLRIPAMLGRGRAGPPRPAPRMGPSSYRRGAERGGAASRELHRVLAQGTYYAVPDESLRLAVCRVAPARPVTGEEISRIVEFARKWSLYDGTERAEAQTFLNELFAAYGQDRHEVGARFEEQQAGRFLDLIWPRVCLVEMKRPSEAGRLATHREQALGYGATPPTPRTISQPRILLSSAPFAASRCGSPATYPNAPRAEFDLVELPERLDALMFLAGRDPMFIGTQAAARRMP